MIEQDGATLVMDARTAGFLDGAKLDYQDGPGGGFLLESPGLGPGCQHGA